jgi:hypothetical protein
MFEHFADRQVDTDHEDSPEGPRAGRIRETWAHGTASSIALRG